jgi:hypothetical protein
VSIGNVLDFDRTFGTSSAMETKYRLTYRTLFELSCGMSTDLERKGAHAVFGEACYTGIPLGILHIDPGFKILALNYSAYEKTFTSYVPHLRISISRVFIHAGVNFRSLSSGNWSSLTHPQYFESIFYWNAGGFVDIPRLRCRLVADVGNFDSFYAGNGGVFRVFARSQWSPVNRFNVLLGLGVQTTGNIDLTSTFHHFFAGLGGELSL